MGRRNLVIVRAGDKSLHPQWLDPRRERSWDLVVSYFGKDPHIFKGPDVIRIDGPGPKWPALGNLLQERPDLLDGYSRIWLPDDDLAADQDGITELFAICERFDLKVAQPALTWDSYFGHVTTLQNPHLQLRYTNYVEVMAPCLTKDVLVATLPFFNSNLSGWGLDFVWPQFVMNPQRDIAIVDAVVVRHTRPVGGPNYKALRENGISPWEELRTFCSSHGIAPTPVITTYAALRRDGRLIDAQSRPRRFSLSSVLAYLPALRRSPERSRMQRRLLGMGAKGLCNVPDRVSEERMTLRNFIADALSRLLPRQTGATR